jgi:hypothetical protein
VLRRRATATTRGHEASTEVVTRSASPSMLSVLFAVHPGWRERFRAMITSLLVRAQEAGAARDDLTAEDVVLALLGVAGTMTVSAQTSPDQWRRQLAIALEGMKALDAQPLPGLPSSSDQLDSDLGRWGSGVLRNSNALP